MVDVLASMFYETPMISNVPFNSRRHHQRMDSLKKEYISSMSLSTRYLYFGAGYS